MKIIIIEDEKNAIITLQSFIHKYIPDVKICGIANNKKEGIDLIKKSSFDIVLLDINLGDGTGFEILKNIENRNFGVIFTTAYDEYAITAFKYSAIDYLLKPINPKELIEALNRYRRGVYDVSNQQLNMATSYVNKINNNKIAVNSLSEIHFIELDEILHLKSDKNYTDIFLKDKQRITSTKTLKFYEQLLPENKFLRIHQKHIINLGCVLKYLKEDGGYVLLTDNSKLEVSRRRKERLMNCLLNNI